MTTHSTQSDTHLSLIHPVRESVGAQCLAPTSGMKVEQAAVAAVFLDSLGINAETLHVTAAGRVECMVSEADWLRASRALQVEHGGEVTREPGFLIASGRVDGVPVEVFAGVDQ